MMHRLPILALAVAAFACSSAVMAETLSDCVAIPSDDQRLACYDRVTRMRRNDPSTRPPAPRADPLEPPPAAASPAPDRTDPAEFGFENRSTAEDLDEIQSRYDGSFTGWSGQTLFRLENGQVWKQARTTRSVSHRAERPLITIKRGAFGTFRLHVEGLNSSVQVKRVK